MIRWLMWWAVHLVDLAAVWWQARRLRQEHPDGTFVGTMSCAVCGETVDHLTVDEWESWWYVHGAEHPVGARDDDAA